MSYQPSFLARLIDALTKAEQDGHLYGTGFIKLTRDTHGEFDVEWVDCRSVRIYDPHAEHLTEAQR